MNILVHGGVYRNNYQLGIRRYYDQLLPRLVARGVTVSLWLDGLHAGGLPPRCRIIGCRAKYVAPSDWPRRAWRKLSPPRVSEPVGPFDAYHGTFFQPPPQGQTYLPEVCTVHDMIAERFPELCGEEGRQQAEAKAEAIRRATQIITISKATAEELLRFYPEVEGRVSAIHLGADHIPLAQRRRATGYWTRKLGSAFALHVGHRDSYKNFAQVIEAARSNRWPTGLRVAVVGPEPSDYERRKTAPHEDRFSFLGPQSDRQVAALMAEAAFAIVPSRCEGFGLPVLEAQRYGTPVLCSDIPVFHEVAGDGAEFFPLDSADALAERAGALLEDGGLRERLRDRGHTNSARFLWDDCADLTMDVFRKALA